MNLKDSSSNPLPECPDSPNCFRATWYSGKDVNTTFEALEMILEEMNLYELKTTKESHSIDAVFKIPVFGYLDDVNIIISKTDDKESGSFVHLKSASREGYYDLGVNKRRVAKILHKLKKEIQS